MASAMDIPSHACPQCQASLYRGVHEVTCFVRFQSELAQRHPAFVMDAEIDDLQRVETRFEEWRERVRHVGADPHALQACINARRDDVDACIADIVRARHATTRARSTNTATIIATAP